MATLSMDLRQRIVSAYDRKQGTQDEIAKRFAVSLGRVKKLLPQRRCTGEIAPRHRFSGRKPKILESHRSRLKELVRAQPDLTLEQLRRKAGLECTLPAIHYVLVDMEKRRSARSSRTDRTS